MRIVGYLLLAILLIHFSACSSKGSEKPPINNEYGNPTTAGATAPTVVDRSHENRKENSNARGSSPSNSSCRSVNPPVIGKVGTLDLTVEHINQKGQKYFKWKIGKNYRDGIFSYNKLTIVTYTATTATRVKDFLEQERNGAKGVIKNEKSLIRITNFDDQMFINVARATKDQKIGEDILDVILTHCYECERVCNSVK
ncbi:MAG: hypothetical protein BWK78_02535 [Thiotrichaceae bacterium IS1]|nr:MAG: hypothetical protein BWK78_02535 [Thiotrichaceae bacterium IS1]